MVAEFLGVGEGGFFAWVAGAAGAMAGAVIRSSYRVLGLELSDSLFLMTHPGAAECGCGACRHARATPQEWRDASIHRMPFRWCFA